MKFLKFIGILTVLFAASGCSTTTQDQLCECSYNDLCTYHQKIGNKCLQYIQQDQNMTIRDKNTYIIYYKNMESFLNTVEVKK